MVGLNHWGNVSRNRQSIAERFDVRSNSLNFIRLGLATLVIVAHSTPIGGFSFFFMLGTFDLGRLAVAGFFGISGYLITQSRMRSSAISYTVKRAARIFPGYWACLIVTAFGFAWAASLARAGWTMAEALTYVTSNFNMNGGAQTIGGTLSGAEFPYAWNGSLWTLRYEVFCYLAIGVALTIGWARRNRLLIVGSFVGFTLITVALMAVGGPQVLVDLFTLATVFLAGACLYFWSDKVPLTAPVACMALFALIAVSFVGYGPALGGLFIAYLVIYLGIVLPAPFKRVGLRNDISYGVYLYGFPVQQSLVLLGTHNQGHLLFIAASITCTIPFAWASWYVVEQPSMHVAQHLLTRRKQKKLEAA